MYILYSVQKIRLKREVIYCYRDVIRFVIMAYGSRIACTVVCLLVVFVEM